MKKQILLIAFLAVALGASAQLRMNLDADWQFAFGHAADPKKDFGCGTEYFNYLTKANSIHNEGPYCEKFDASKWPNLWTTVNLPHDWVVDLPFAAEASHSHGYKTVGWKYPETSVGWYRKVFNLDKADEGRHFELCFEGIFRNAQIWVNGFYLGGEPSGYVFQCYDITDYLNFDKENLVCVRVDASLEEGWFYEGAGIYRHVWLTAMAPLHVANNGVFAHSALAEDFASADVTVSAEIVNDGREQSACAVHHTLLAADGSVVGTTICPQQSLLPRERREFQDVAIHVANPELWDTERPYLYTLRTEVLKDGKAIDRRDTKIGLRQVVFDADHGLLLNGKSVKIKGACMHQDHAGVGVAIPDGLQVYRLEKLKKIGMNGYRSSHNPMSPAMLEACDSLGILVVEENRLTGINDYQIGQLRSMIRRDRNHPSIIAWSVGNEEWGFEWTPKGTEIVQTMCDYAHRFDPTRPATVATSGGPTPVVKADIAGYNYVIQNPIDEHRRNYPDRKAFGTEETTGAGTRGVYFNETGDDFPHFAENQYDEFARRNPLGRMPAFNLGADRDSTMNRIERGWKFYNERPWLSGLFFWTGFDYRGEPNPLSFPATGSEFGILDYCGFLKDEAYYLKAWWTNEPVLHLLPHWNLAGHEGEIIDVWAYSNCDEVELFVNGKSLGRKRMEKNGHLSWKAVYKPGRVKAVGYKNGRKQITETIETTGEAVSLKTVESDYNDVTVIDVYALDDKGRFVPDACNLLNISVDGNARILGVGNGDPAWQEKERPLPNEDQQQFAVKLFNGCAQILLQNGNAANMKCTIQK